MAVVRHHIGKPTNITIAQNEAITYPRNRILSGDSGGGSFFLRAMLTALDGGASFAIVVLPSLSLPSTATVVGDSVGADMAMFVVVVAFG